VRVEQYKFHLGRKHTCDVPGCPKSFKSSSARNRHQRAAHEGQVYGCDVPGRPKSYNSAWMLKVHYETIHENRKYPCTISGCSRSFSSPTINTSPYILEALGTQIPLRYAWLYKALLAAQVPNYTSKVIFHEGQMFQCDFPGCSSSLPMKKTSGCIKKETTIEGDFIVRF
jgi:hypothetical protein